MLMKSRLHGAQKGHGLLKKKADALQMRFRMILGKIIEVSLSSHMIIKRRSFLSTSVTFGNTKKRVSEKELLIEILRLS